MTFEEYLLSKKIDSAAFQAAEPERWKEWEQLFQQMSPVSFTAQKLYLINPIRRKYHSPGTPVSEASTEPAKPKPGKPVFKPKIS